ncbi:hypothetical protein F4801DRAFT_391658 [Xylaria longipes]|nr:hypothetical protein F4801DRAFT_391658 [Xylaria longipes]
MSTAPGWAIRRNGWCLLSKEVDCGETANGYRACCPSITTCPHQYNAACCPPDTNCTAAIVDTPSCANSSWIMFDNAGYFCCESGQVGYDLGNTDGCSMSGKPLPADANPLAVVSQIFSSTFTPTSATPTSPSLTTSSSMISSPTTSPTTSTTTRGGDIAGAVVGGTAGIVIIGGLLWFFVRKKKSSKTTASGVSRPPAEGYVSKDEGNQYTGYYATPTAGPSEIGGTPTAELTGVTDRGRSEMP